MRPQITESITGFDPNAGLNIDGFMASQRNAQTAHRKRVREAARLIVDVSEGRTDRYFLKQAFRPTEASAMVKIQESYPGLINLREAPIGGMSITDFSILTLDVLDRILYGYWDATPILSKPMVRMHPLTDFRNVSRYLMDGAATPPEAVPPGAQPKEKVLGPQTLIQYAPQKYEAFTRVVWEAMVNDDLGVFTDLGQRLVIGANRGIELFLTGLYVDANGPNATLYTTANKNQIIQTNGAASNNPILDAQGLQDAFTVLARQVDADGYPIILTGKMYLWYGPHYAATVQNLMHMLSVQLSVNGGVANAQGFPSQFVNVNNWMVQNLVPIMNPFIRLVCTTATTQDTMWGITLDPGAQNRPAMEFGFLRGFEVPQLFQKVPNTMRAGGGVAPELGDFYTMAQEMKVLSVYGGKQIAGQTTVASTGRAT
jgi:hypothetical protein